MADDGPHASAGQRHAHRPAPTGRRWLVPLIALSVLVVAALVVGLVLWTGDGSGDAVAERTSASTTPGSVAATTSAPTPTETTPDVPPDFVNAMQQIGIPLDPQTGWVLSQGICVRLGQPDRYNQFAMAEGIERLFPSVSDEQSHAFVAMVAASVCHL